MTWGAVAAAAIGVVGGAATSSKGNKATNVQTSMDPWSKSIPYRTKAMDVGTQLYSQSLQNPDYLQAQGMTRQAAGDTSLQNMGQAYTTDVLSGKYLHPAENPYLDSVIGKAMSDVNSQFEGAGRYGSGANQDALMRAAGAIRYQDFATNQQNERANQMQAMNALPGLQTMQYQGPTALMGLAQYPTAQYQQYANAINMLGSPGGTSTQPYFTNPLAAGIGGGLTGLGIYNMYAGRGGAGFDATSQAVNPSGVPANPATQSQMYSMMGEYA